MLAGLRFAHRAGIVHRDVKPHNVIVDSEGRVKVMDFGIARAGTSQMTEVGSIIGTAQYLSPEQARGAPVDESSDLYSTGILLYELLTGTVPFNGETPVEVAMKHLSQVPEPPSRLRPEVPHDLDLVVIRALAKEPAERYRSAQEMDRDLERVTRGEGVDRETEDAATMVMRGETTAATMVGGRTAPGYGGDERYRAYDGEVRKSRSWWPWLLALGLALAIGVGGFILYDNVSGRLDASKTIAVDNYTGLLESKAVGLIIEDGFEDRVRRVPNSEVAEGYVIEQEPAPGTRLQKGSIVTIDVSTGRPEVTVPPLIGKSRDEAVRDLTALNLEVSVVEVNSDKQFVFCGTNNHHLLLPQCSTTSWSSSRHTHMACTCRRRPAADTQQRRQPQTATPTDPHTHQPVRHPVRGARTPTTRPQHHTPGLARHPRPARGRRRVRRGAPDPAVPAEPPVHAARPAPPLPRHRLRLPRRQPTSVRRRGAIDLAARLSGRRRRPGLDPAHLLGFRRPAAHRRAARERLRRRRPGVGVPHALPRPVPDRADADQHQGRPRRPAHRRRRTPPRSTAAGPPPAAPTSPSTPTVWPST